MQLSTRPSTVSELLSLAASKGLVTADGVSPRVTARQIEDFEAHVCRVGRHVDEANREAFEDELNERKLGRASGVLDEGQDVVNDLSTEEGVLKLQRVLKQGGSGLLDNSETDYPTCFAVMCRYLGVVVAAGTKSPSELSAHDLATLSLRKRYMVALDWYGLDDKRNHVVAVSSGSGTGTISYSVKGSASQSKVVKCVTTAQEFFNKGGRFFGSSFYTDDAPSDAPLSAQQLASMFGSDRLRDASDFVPPPQSVVNDDSRGGGSANTTGGVVRSKKRVVKSIGTFTKDVGALRTYAVTGTTLFNNVDELYLDTISREYAQEILEDLFDVWGLPTSDPIAMQYAEDLVWVFMIARTASNKANYDSEFEVPSKSGSVIVNFSKLSVLLADKYGITRRNFARGVADDMRAYLLRPENQFIRSKSAQRVNADPQYGQLCFDGSTGCASMTSSDITFCRVLEARNLYERDDVIAEGASDRLMQGMHGGVRSKVAR